jgi:hypothetical protein
MISAGNRNPLYDGAPVPTSPLDPPPRRSDDHPSYPAAAQVDDASGTLVRTPHRVSEPHRTMTVEALAAHNSAEPFDAWLANPDWIEY